MKLEFRRIHENDELLPASVCSFLMPYAEAFDIRTAEIDPAFADGENMHTQYGVNYEEELNCLVVEGSRNEIKCYAALVVPYGKRANMNAKVRNPLDAKKVSFAPLELVTELSGQEYGSITPVGLPQDWLVLVDASVMEQDRVVIGGGLAHSKLQIPTALFKEMANAVIVEGLAKE
ncbi:MAG: proline--tRNA ligase [Erysipelotrichaceae bacterium]|nr:proline--tRNA ligase [Erysipelotrichaceae bacterium]